MPATTVSVYSYWEGTGLDHLELAARPGAFFVAAPTNDDLTFVTVQVPSTDAGRFRNRTEDAFHEALEQSPTHHALVTGSRRAERFRFARIPDGFLRRAHGPGWALVGDAGYHKDPVTAQGMADAFRDAELLADAVHQGIDGGQAGLETELTRYEEVRDLTVLPMHEFTAGLADLEAPPAPEMDALIAALADQPEHVARFLGVIAGSVPVPEFFDPANLGTILSGVPVTA